MTTEDLSLAVTIILAITSILSPIIVAIINNWHHSKIRRKELEHDARIRQMDLQQQAITHQLSIYYEDKKVAFSEFLNAAGTYSMGKQSTHDYENIQAATQTVLLFCNSENQALILEFLNYIDDIVGDSYSHQERSEYSKTLAKLTIALNQELEATKPELENY